MFVILGPLYFNSVKYNIKNAKIQIFIQIRKNKDKKTENFIKGERMNILKITFLR